MADTGTLSAAASKAPSSMPAVAGGSVAAAVCAIAIFHGNNVLLNYGFAPIPTEIAAQYQIVLAYLGAVLAHRFANH